MGTNLKIALRDSKAATRPYVIVNSMLAKHIPVTPSEALEHFKSLGDKISQNCNKERVLVIGFAETATAVGAAVAVAVRDVVYVHTTREEPSEDFLVTEFLEEHSHAKNQALYLQKEMKDLTQYDRIVFVEDEITTGKTILNFLKKINWSGKITISALVFNGLDETVFSEYKADFICLQKIGYVKSIEFCGLTNPRSGVYINEYDRKCLELTLQIIKALNENDIVDKNILVIGTEEFMYMALVLGNTLEKTAKSVLTQSTTRSPLLTGDFEDYPFFRRNCFKSVYDGERTTYLYNLKKYDTVIVVTDAIKPKCDELLQAIQIYGNQNIYFVRIRNA